MSETFQRLEGIILKTIPFRDYDEILVVFTQEEGVVKALLKGARSRKRGLQGLCSPLNHIEMIYCPGKGEIGSCREISCLNPYSTLRQRLEDLLAGCDCLKALLQSQWTHKPAPKLYELLLKYLAFIPHVSNPQVLALSFRLKLLKYEGLLSFPLICSTCQQPLESHAFEWFNEMYCASHQPMGSKPFREEELLLMRDLTEAQRLSSLSLLHLPHVFNEKVEHLFHILLQRT